jgi:adenylyltransferase/sulfurtransferase
MMKDELDLAQLKEWSRQGLAFQLIDVREASEREIHHIGGDWIPFGEVMQRTDEIARDKPVVLYCRKGIRSRIAIQRLRIKFPDLGLWNLKDGIGDGMA